MQSPEEEEIRIIKAAGGITRDAILRKKYSMEIYDIGESLSSPAEALSFCPVQLHTQFSSKLLIDHLHAQGFCSAYYEVARFERNAAIMTNTVLDVQENSFVHHAANNADHDTCTVDGNGIFQGMASLFIFHCWCHNSRFTKP